MIHAASGHGRALILFIGVTVAAAACASPGPGTASATPTSGGGSSRSTAPAPAASTPASAPARGASLPRPDHTVVVVMENHSYSSVIGNPQAPYLNSLARSGALLINSHGVTHPSEPNYLALFSGSTQGLADDSCPHAFSAANLGSELIAAGLSFAGYSEGLPATGSYVCAAGDYARKHVPWTDFPNVPASANKPLTAYPAGHYARLPDVSFVIPDLCHDMHDCPVAEGDAWLARHISGYATWAMTHHSLLIVTWDEDDGGAANQIPTIVVGQQAKPGRYGRTVTHYGVLRTIEDMYGLRPTGLAARARPLAGIWR